MILLCSGQPPYSVSNNIPVTCPPVRRCLSQQGAVSVVRETINCQAALSICQPPVRRCLLQQGAVSVRETINRQPAPSHCHRSTSPSLPSAAMKVLFLSAKQSIANISCAKQSSPVHQPAITDFFENGTWDAVKQAVDRHIGTLPPEHQRKVPWRAGSLPPGGSFVLRARRVHHPSRIISQNSSNYTIKLTQHVHSRNSIASQLVKSNL